jgi:N-acetylglucosamine kinase-like BadF-type ATPase
MMFEAQRKNIDQRIDDLVFTAYDAGWNAAVDMLNEVIKHKRAEGDDIAVAVLEFARARFAECDE